MIHESNFKPELTPHRRWMEDAKSNMEKYRGGLLKAAAGGDVSKVSFWSSNFFSAYKYFSDIILPSRSANTMLVLAGEINDTARGIYLDIDTFDPQNVAAVAAALEGFQE